ncbi:hypothetical protein BSL78_26497 [Apostichopus japonicus]|uniref:EGF-like domain-containing protein n=1 Tax=Stichopus japonicus TaxID=307972 RepID=A0A2G8JLN7_STIJA|nr:hypothetical protein BSL78_26497 [Apostichopus japonicus]
MARQLLWSLIRSALGKPKFIVCRNNSRLLSLKIFSFSLKFADKKDCQEDDVCSVNFICQEEEPGFSCDCPDGFQVIEGACTDINECDLDPCLDEATCHNTEGSFHCQCPGGFQGDGRPSASGCQDIDECQTRTARCPAKSDCVNEEGSYVCICQLGYELIGELCVDIDECKDSRLHDCALNSSCVNIPGTFTASVTQDSSVTSV